MPDEKAPLIALLATPETSPSVLYGLYDVLYSVGAVYPDMTVGEPGAEALDVKIVAADGRPFRCIGDILVEPHASLEDVVEADAVVVCDMYTPINVSPKGKYPEEVALAAPNSRTRRPRRFGMLWLCGPGRGRAA